MRDTIGQIGQNVTTKEGKFGTCKIIPQFSKCIDPDLPFYYYTPALSQYYEGSHSDFDRPPVKQPKRKGYQEESDLQLFGPMHVTMPVIRTLAVRSKFHNIPLELAPPPNDPIAFHEHSYAQSINNKLLYLNYLHFGGTTR